MRVTLLGHASVLVEAAGRAVLVDPVFTDTFAEGMLTMCPARRVVPGRLPKIDLVVVTDAYPDHFDLATMAQLSRDCAVMCPKDDRILYGLAGLGFKKVLPAPASSIHRSGDQFELVTTPSARRVTEFGVVIKDRSGVFWHPAATQVTAPLVDQVRAQLGRVDLFFARHTVPDLTFFGAQRHGFPGPFLRDALTCAGRVAPALVVPGSGGVRFMEPFAWTNAFLFPISRQRFTTDLRRAAPNIASATGNPGDVFEIRAGIVERRAGASAAVTLTDDDSHRIDLDPTATVPPLTDPNLDGYAPDALAAQVGATFDELTQYVAAEHTRDPVLLDHQRCRGSYGLGVVFPDGSERWLRVIFGEQAPLVERGDGSIRGALNTQRIAASVLTARARHERSYPYPGGLTRGTVISPARLVDGNVAVEPREPPDLLMHYLRNKPPGWPEHSRRFLDFQLRALLAAGNRP